MTRLIYMAHPVTGDVIANLARAMRWLLWLNATQSDVYIAPWIAEMLADPSMDANPDGREAGLRRDEFVVSRCDGVVLVGGIVTEGMQREADMAEMKSRFVWDWTRLGLEPPQ